LKLRKILSATPTAYRPRAKVEALEPRQLLSASYLASINTTDAGSYPSNVVQVGSFGFFTANHGAGGRVLYKTDGTPGGTSKVSNVNVGTFTIFPSQDAPALSMAALGSEAYFSASDGTHGYELWKSDGTSTGTSMVVDLTPGSVSSEISQLTSFGGKFFLFWAIRPPLLHCTKRTELLPAPFRS
jgi:ELWxxDGT repeat protein